MQFSREISAANLIAAWEPGRIRIAERWIEGHVIVAAESLEQWTPAEPAELTSADLEPALALDPEVVVIGTGLDQRLPDLDLMAAFAARGVGVEIMSTAAACRTYNVLVHEGRRVVAALVNAASGSTAP